MERREAKRRAFIVATVLVACLCHSYTAFMPAELKKMRRKNRKQEESNGDRRRAKASKRGEGALTAKRFYNQHRTFTNHLYV